MAAAQASGFHAEEIVPVNVPGRKRGEVTQITLDEHPRADTTIDVLSALKPLFGANGTVTAGNASGINDGAAALIIASEAAVKAHGLTPRAHSGPCLGGGGAACDGRGADPGNPQVDGQTGPDHP
jgi:3-oxoadipyl-CoA thiolase